MFESADIVGMPVHRISFANSLNVVCDWGLNRRPGFVCFANVHMTVEAHKDPLFRKELAKAALILPDGKPLAIAMRWFYKKQQERVSGMDFMPALLERANALKARIFLYGSTQEVLEKLQEEINIRYPHVVVAGAISPPFRPLSAPELASHVESINRSGAQFVLVALGCPKQEKWMAANSPSINAVLLGLGGAFPVMAGIHKRSPRWMQNLSLEWLYRLLQEPRRMFKRYLYTNSLFIWLLLKKAVKGTRNIAVHGKQTSQP